MLAFVSIESYRYFLQRFGGASSGTLPMPGASVYGLNGSWNLLVRYPTSENMMHRVLYNMGIGRLASLRAPLKVFSVSHYEKFWGCSVAMEDLTLAPASNELGIRYLEDYQKTGGHKYLVLMEPRENQVNDTTGLLDRVKEMIAAVRRNGDVWQIVDNCFILEDRALFVDVVLYPNLFPEDFHRYFRTLSEELDAIGGRSFEQQVFTCRQVISEDVEWSDRPHTTMFQEESIHEVSQRYETKLSHQRPGWESQMLTWGEITQLKSSQSYIIVWDERAREFTFPTTQGNSIHAGSAKYYLLQILLQNVGTRLARERLEKQVEELLGTKPGTGIPQIAHQIREDIGGVGRSLITGRGGFMLEARANYAWIVNPVDDPR
jgi:hypothetical protein